MALTDMVEVKEITMEVGKWAQSWVEDDAKLGAFTRSRFEFREEQRIELLGRLRTFVTEILERKIVEDSYPTTFTYKVPTSWWQTLKRDKLPRWFVRRYPVKFDSKTIRRTVNITRKATYPMADIVMPRNMGTVVIKDVVSPLNFYEYEDE